MDSPDRKLRILVVDDDDVSRTVLHAYLNDVGHDVLIATDAASAMNLLQSDPVQIVIADWIMPGASGLDLCKWVRCQPWGSAVHFVMLTVLSDKTKQIEAFHSDVDDFLSKPLHEGELLARLRAWTRTVRLKELLAQRHAEALRANQELVLLNEKLADQAIHDELTGLPNRREAMRRLQEQWAIAQRYQQPLSCAIVDVDRFKELNDTYGHRTGDEVLKQLAHRLKQSVRESDGVFRIGGDEFLVLLPVIESADAEAWAQRCRTIVSAEPFVVMERAHHLTITVGVAQRLDSMRHVSEVVDAADNTLLTSKRATRNPLRPIADSKMEAPAAIGK